ncbi:hypothetical protein EDC01DRAFT_257131 [Geopyxis carbonaria]|nr:hypothetical protein EDC01DRAFT_257131 [Geopyxis carbonaria]
MVTATLKQLYPPPNIAGVSGELNIDIVFVHGLNIKDEKDHGRLTWTHKNGVCWPEMLLPKSIPTARVLSFEYNSAVFRGTSNARLQDHADSLLDQLRGKRVEKSVAKRPIIFVCHSLGGLLVKQALINTRTNHEQYGDISKRTYGLMFFGTPHSGGNFVQFAKCMANIWSAHTGEPKNNMLAMLGKESILTELMTEAFRYQKDKFKVVSFVESRPMKIRSAVWLPFASKMIVDREYAILGNSAELVLDLNRDHSSLCKFSSHQDPAYEIVERHLKEFVRKAIKPPKPPRPSKVLAPPKYSQRSQHHYNQHYTHYPQMGTVTVAASTTSDSKAAPVINFLNALGYSSVSPPLPAKKKNRSKSASSASSGKSSGISSSGASSTPSSSPKMKQIEMSSSLSPDIIAMRNGAHNPISLV